MVNVDPDTQQAGESSKAKIFAPEKLPKEAKKFTAADLPALFMTFLDIVLNVMVPAAGYYLEKYLEANYEWTNKEGVIMIPAAIVAVYLVSGDFIQILMLLTPLGYDFFKTKDMNKALYYYMTVFDWNDALFSVFTMVVSGLVLFDWYKGDTKDTEYWVNLSMFVLSIIMFGWNTFEFFVQALVTTYA